MTIERISKDECQRQYTFRLSESVFDRCHECIFLEGDKCWALDIVIANPKKSQCPAFKDYLD